MYRDANQVHVWLMPGKYLLEVFEMATLRLYKSVIVESFVHTFDPVKRVRKQGGGTAEIATSRASNVPPCGEEPGDDGSNLMDEILQRENLCGIMGVSQCE
jgi:hypothetical protein